MVYLPLGRVVWWSFLDKFSMEILRFQKVELFEVTFQ